MADPSLWLQRPPGSGKPINEPWGTDDPKSGGPTAKYFLNFSNPATQKWWVEEYVGPVFDEPNIDGVYTDCSCGSARGYRVTEAELIGRQLAFDAALRLAQSKVRRLSSPSAASACMQSATNTLHGTCSKTGFRGTAAKWCRPVCCRASGFRLGPVPQSCGHRRQLATARQRWTDCSRSVPIRATRCSSWADGAGPNSRSRRQRYSRNCAQREFGCTTKPG